MIALGGSGDCDQSFVAVILRLVDLDNTTTELANLVDFRTALSNDSSDHVIWNEYLLSQWLTRNKALHRLSRGSSMILGNNMASLLRLLWSDTSVASNGR